MSTHKRKSSYDSQRMCEAVPPKRKPKRSSVETRRTVTPLAGNPPGVAEGSHDTRSPPIRLAQNGEAGGQVIERKAHHGKHTLGQSDKTMYMIWTSQHVLPVVTAAIHLDVFDFLNNKKFKQSGASPEEISKACGMTHQGCVAILRVLLSLGLLQAVEGYRAALSDAGRWFLASESPFSWCHVLSSTIRNTEHQRLLQVLKGVDLRSSAQTAWEKGSISKHQASAVTAMMHRLGCASGPRLARMVSTLDIFGGTPPRVKTSKTTTRWELLDVAGGSGVYASHILEEYPCIGVTVGELKGVCNEVEKAGYLRPGVNLIAMDALRDEWPVGFNAHLLSNVLHDWDVILLLLYGTRKMSGHTPEIVPISSSEREAPHSRNARPRHCSFHGGPWACRSLLWCPHASIYKGQWLV
ncbi:hypothetical protein AAMO2058_000016000 [Amorphochlora amoebiformis]